MGEQGRGVKTFSLPLGDRHPQKEFFTLNILDVVLKDDTASVEHPMFSLMTNATSRRASRLMRGSRGGVQRVELAVVAHAFDPG